MIISYILTTFDFDLHRLHEIFGQNPSWESQILPCWDAARANYNNCAARSGADAHCKVLFADMLLFAGMLC
jgi:hypothetical protein